MYGANHYAVMQIFCKYSVRGNKENKKASILGVELKINTWATKKKNARGLTQPFLRSKWWLYKNTEIEVRKISAEALYVHNNNKN